MTIDHLNLARHLEAALSLVQDLAELIPHDEPCASCPPMADVQNSAARIRAEVAAAKACIHVET
jgi:hypothetical protein